jgi:hypothetical protein
LISYYQRTDACVLPAATLTLPQYKKKPLKALHLRG